MVIYSVEFVWMYFLRVVLGSSPSEASYGQKKWNVAGLIAPTFAPAWLVASLVLEVIYRYWHQLPLGYFGI